MTGEHKVGKRAAAIGVLIAIALAFSACKPRSSDVGHETLSPAARSALASDCRIFDDAYENMYIHQTDVRPGIAGSHDEWFQDQSDMIGAILVLWDGPIADSALRSTTGLTVIPNHEIPDELRAAAKRVWDQESAGSFSDSDLAALKDVERECAAATGEYAY